MTDEQKTVVTALVVFSLIVGMFISLGLSLVFTALTLDDNAKRMQYATLFGITVPETAEERALQAPKVQAMLDQMEREVMFAQVYYDQARVHNMVTELDKEAVQQAYVRLRTAQKLLRYFKVLDAGQDQLEEPELVIPTSQEKFFVYGPDKYYRDCFFISLEII